MLRDLGDEKTADDLTEAIERELRKLASSYMRRERAGHTLQTTAVVNEAFVRLMRFGQTPWTDRPHFLAVASRVMRHVLVDYARARQAGKRVGNRVALDSAAAVSVGPISTEVLDVHMALEEFSAISPRQAQLVELRFFGGLSLDEAAEVIGISSRMADDDWILARAWLRRRLAAR